MLRHALAPDLEFSRIIYGMWRIADNTDTSPAAIQSKIETCLAHGITTMDQADIYGAYGAEALLGACLKQAPDLREKIEIVTKCGIVAPIGKYADAKMKHYDTSRAHIMASVESSLTNIHIETIDLLLIHRPDPLMDHEETGRALDAVITSGKVRHVGVSNFKPHDFTLLQSAMKNRLATNQIEINVIAHEPFTNGDIAFLQERGIAPMAWSPLAGGSLFQPENDQLRNKLQPLADQLDTDIANLMFAWLLHHPAHILPIIGTNNVERIKSLAQAINIPMTRQSWYEIYTAALGHEVA